MGVELKIPIKESTIKKIDKSIGWVIDKIFDVIDKSIMPILVTCLMYLIGIAISMLYCMTIKDFNFIHILSYGLWYIPIGWLYIAWHDNWVEFEFIKDNKGNFG